MKIRNLIFAAASAALIAAPVAAQANTRANASSVAVSSAALGNTARASSTVAGEEFAEGIPVIIWIAGFAVLTWVLIETFNGDSDETRTPGA